MGSNRFRGQSSTEFLILFAAAVAIFAILYSVTVGRGDAFNSRNLELSANLAVTDLANAAREVHGQGTGARKIVTINLPRSYDPENSRISQNAIILRAKNTDYVRTFSFLLQGSMPESTGTYYWAVENDGTSVVIGDKFARVNRTAISAVVIPGWDYSDSILVSSSSLFTMNGTVSLEWPDTAEVTMAYNSSNFTIVPFGSYEIPLQAFMDYTALGSYFGKLTISLHGQKGDQVFSIPITLTASKDKFNAVRFMPPTPEDGAEASGTIVINASIASTRLTQQRFLWRGNYTYSYDDSLVLAYNFDDVKSIGDTASKVKDISLFGNDGTIYGNTALLLHMDETSGLKAFDESVYGNNGTCYNMGSYTGASRCNWAAGKSGNGIQFDGVNDYVSMPSSNSLNSSGPFSISFWVNAGVDNTQMTYFSKGTGSSDRSLAVFRDVWTNKLFFNLWGASGGQIGRREVTFPNQTQWNQIVVTYDGGSSYLATHVYINGIDAGGVQDDSGTFGSSLRQNPAGIRIGSSYAPSAFFNGTIDEVMIANRSLSASEVLAQYNAGKAHHADWDADGKWGSALKFDGVDDYLNAGGVDAFQGEYAISAWVNPVNISRTGSNDVLAAVDPSILTHGVLMELGSPSSNNVRFLHRYPAGSSGGDSFYSNGQLPVNAWSYITFVRTSTTMYIYINGALDNTKPVTTSSFANALNVTLGRLTPIDSGRSFNGSIDEVRIWNRSLSASEVQQHYYSNLAKYSPATWMFTAVERGLSSGSYDYRAYVRDNSGQENSTELRTVLVNNSLISLVPPTPASGYLTTTASSLFYPPAINASIRNVTNLSSMEFNWGGQSYSFYDPSLVLAYNFDNVEALGEGNITKDVSPYGNDGALYGNTKLLLRFDENGSSGTAYDESAYKNNGAVYGNTKLLLRFDESAGNQSVDETAYRNNATCYYLGVIANCNRSTGVSGSALRFYGASADSRAVIYPVVGNNKAEETISFWVKPSAIPDAIQTLYSAGHNSVASSNYMIIYQYGTSIKFSLYVSTYQTIIASGVLSPGVWTHVVAVHSSSASKQQLYINGVSVANGSTYADASVNHNYVVLGKDEQLGNYFTGSLDEVSMYTRPLSYSEISDLYNAGRAKHADYVEGKSGTALQFDGVDDYVDAGSASSLTLNNSFTYEAWFKPNDVTTYQVFLALGLGGQPPTSTGDVRVQAGNLDAYWHGSGGVYAGRQGTTTLVNGTWYHVAVVFVNGSFPTVYLNGVSEGVTAGTAQSFTGTSWKAWVGKTLYADAAKNFNGTLDEIALYSKALNSAEVLAHYNAGKAKHVDWTAAGKVNGALEFDGVDDYVDTGEVARLNISGAITLSAWINYGGSGDLDVLSKVKASNAYGPFSFGFSNTAQGFYESADGSSWGTAIGSSNVYPYGWHQMTATSNATVANLYVDGVLVGSDATPAASKILIPEHARIGWYYGSSYSRHFNGALDEVRVWNRSLSAAEVAQHYYGSLNKYAPDKWLFTSTPQNYAGTYTYFASVTTNESVTESTPVQNVTVLFNRIGFIPATPANGESTSNTTITVNASIYNLTLDSMAFNWNGTNTSFLDSSLVLAYNFDDVAAIGDTAGTVKDVSRAGNNGAVYGNTVMLLHMDENTGTTAYDNGRFGNNATISGATWVSGKSGSALYFDGVNDYAATSSFSSNITADFSFGAWVKTSVVQSYQQRIMELSQAATTGFQICMGPSGAYGTENSGGPTAGIWGPSGQNDGQWHHLFGTREGTTYKFYIDGVYMGSSGGTAPTYARAWIGRNYNFNNFNGSIDEVLVANRSLSASEVLAQYNAGKAKHADWDANGKWNSAMKFDGVDDYVSTPSFALSSADSTTTYSFWLKSYPISASYQNILTDKSQGSSGHIWIYRRSADSLRAEYANGTTYVQPSAVNFFTGYDGVWMKADVVYDYANKWIRFYRNGILYYWYNASDSMLFPSANRVKYVGGTSGYGFFNGSIDEVRIWNRSLSAAEVAQQYYGSLNKYAPDKWLFTSSVGDLATGNYSYYAYAHGANGDSNFTETRSVNILGDMVVFAPPTPENASAVLDSAFQVNASIANLSLSKMRFYLDGNGYEFFNDSLVLAYNFDDVQSIGDTAGKAVDVSGHGNNGTVYGNTALLLHMDEGSGAYAYDESRNSNNARCYHAASLVNCTWTAGKSGSAIKLESGDNVVVSNSASLRGFNAMTILMWAKVTPYNGAAQYLLDGGYWNSPYGYAFRLSPTSNLGDVYLRTTNGNLAFDDYSLTPNQWYQVGFVWNGTNFWMVKDGQFGAQQVLVGTAAPTSDVYLGSQGFSTYLNGSIDEFMIANRSLSASEIQAHYNAGKAKHADWAPDGKWGSAMRFDGANDYVRLPSLNLSSSTLSAWVRPDGYVSACGGRGVIESGTADGYPNYGILYYGNYFASKIRTSAGSVANALSVSPVSASNWYHVAAVHNNATRQLRLYVNGVLESVAENVVSIPNTLAPLTIGYGQNCGVYNYFNGSIDEVRIWNRSLSASEIQQQYYGSLNKYSPNKWLFQSNLSNVDNGVHTVSAWVQDVSGSVGVADNRTIAVANAISFVPPTPTDGILTSYAAVAAAPPVINATIQGIQLSGMNLSWNNTNYSFYDPSLVLAYNFDNVASIGDSETQVIDVSKYGNTGTLVNGTAWTASGKFGGALSFDGVDDYVSIGDYPALRPSVLTISAWINPSTPTTQYQMIVDKQTVAGAYGYTLRLEGTSGKLFFRTYGTSAGDLTGNAVLSADTWYFVTATYDGSYSKIYINGALDASKSNSGTISYDGTVLKVGMRDGGYNFNGSIDEVRVWNRSLSAAEVAQQYYGSLNKYDSDKWVFTSTQSGLSFGSHNYSASVVDSLGTRNLTSLRRLAVSYNRIGFVSPTPDDGSYMDLSQIIQNPVVVNASIVDSAAPQSIIFNWNGTNYSFYDPSLVLAYNFDNVSSIGENATRAVDVSRYGNNGTLVNGTAWNANGKYGGAMKFDGVNDYVNVGNDSSLNAQAVSIALWVKPAKSVQNQYARLVEKLFSESYYLGADTTGTKFKGIFAILDSPYGSLESTTVIAADTWYYVVALHDGSNDYLYVNGKLESTQANTASLNSVSPVFIGRYTQSNTGLFNGTIDEVRIWNRSLSASEVQQHYYGNLAKYTPTRWLFQSSQPINTTGTYTYYAYLNDSAGANFSEVRSLVIGNNSWISFIPPTPESGAATSNKTVTLNASISGIALSQMKLNWNGTNYSFYDPDLVLALNFDNVSAIGDSSANVRDVSSYAGLGGVYGAAHYNASGKHGTAMDFNGSGTDYVSFANTNGRFNPVSNRFSVELWLNPRNNSNVGSLNCHGLSVFASDGGDTGCTYNKSGIGYLSGGNILVAAPSFNVHYYYLSQSSNSAVPRDAWSHVAWVYDNGASKIYINGQLDSWRNVTLAVPLFGTLQIGRGERYVYTAFNGSIDEFRLWNRSLTDADVAQHYYGSLNKYASDKWIFTSNQAGLTDSPYSYYAVASDSNGGTNFTSTRSLSVNYSWINFVAPTPADGSASFGDVNLNASISGPNLSELTLNWNGQNTTVYNGSLVLAYNFDDVAAIGDNTTSVKDVSRYGNNGVVYGNTVLMLRMDEGSGSTAYDESGFGHNGGFGGTNWSVGKSGAGKYFDGVDDYMTAGSSGFTWPHTTTEFWYKHAKSQSGTIFAYNIIGDGAPGFWFALSGNTLYAYYLGSGASAVTLGTSTLVPGNWYHITGVFNRVASYAEFYVNGVSAGSTSSFAPYGTWSYGNPLISAGAAYHWVAAAPAGNKVHDYTEGTFDEIAIHNRSLSSSEVLAHYNAGRAKYADWDPNGKFGSAMKFDGVNDYVDAGVRTAYNFTNELTLSAWAKYVGDHKYSSDHDQFIITPRGSYRESFLFGFYDNVPYFYASSTGSSWDWVVSQGKVYGSTGDMGWHQFTATFHKDYGVKLFVDGVLVASNSSTGTLKYEPSANIDVGRRSMGNMYFQGSIDEVRIWNRSLTASEVSQHYYSSLNKYAPDKWLFTSVQQGLAEGVYSYYLYAKDSSASYEFSANRTAEVGNLVRFVPPTPAAGATTSISAIESGAEFINATILTGNLSAFKFNWNGANYSYYDDSLVLAYNFDNVSAIGENATRAVDVSRSGNNGALVNGATWTANGKYGGAMSFDGVNDYVDAGSAPSLNITDAITISAWINPFSWRDSNNFSSRVVCRGYPSRGYDVYLDSGLIGVWWGASNYNSNSNVLVLNSWQHIVLTFSSATHTAYYFVNGADAGSSTVAGTLPSTTDRLYIGSYDLSTRFFNGLIDEVRIWNRSLSADEIQQQYYGSLNKYAPDKWLFSYTPHSIGSNSYYGYAQVTTGNASYSEVRELTVENNAVAFIPQTPADRSFTSNASITINASIAGIPLDWVKLNWNGAPANSSGTNYSFYDNSLLAAYNFDNVAALGDSSNSSSDSSRRGNNATLFGNTMLLLHLDEGTGNKAYDESTRLNNGTIYGSPAWVAGKSGRGISFDGIDDAIYVANSSSLDVANAFTIEMWVRRSNVSYSILDFLRRDSADTYALGTGSNATTIRVRFKDTLGSHHFGTLVNVPTGVWNHVVGLYDGQYLRFYLNGVLAAQDYVGGYTVATGINDLIIGRDDPQVGRFFNGTLDEVAVYSTALSPADVLAHYNAGRAIHADYTLAGKHDGGLMFDGIDDYAQSALPVNLGAGEVTFSAWVKGTPMAANSEQGILSIYNAGKPWFFSLERSTYSGCGSTGCLSMHVGYPDQSPYVLQAGNWSATDSEWHFVGMTRNLTFFVLYMDGVQVASSTSPSFTGFNVGNRYLRLASPSQNYFAGTLDEVRVWNRSLSPAEMQQQYYGNLAKYAPGKWLFSSTQQNVPVGSHSYSVFARNLQSNFTNSTAPRTINVLSNVYIGFTSPTPNNGTSELIDLAPSTQAINVSVSNMTLRNFVFDWNGTNTTYYSDSLVLAYNFDSVSSIGDSSSVVKDVSSYGNNGALGYNATTTSVVIDDFERKTTTGWAEGCAGLTQLNIVKGYYSQYGLSVKATGGDGYACAIKSIPVTNGNSLSYACKGDLCKVCLYNGSACKKTVEVCDYGLGKSDSDWRTCSTTATQTGTLQLRVYAAYYDGYAYNNAPGASSQYDFFTLGPIPTAGKYGGAMQFDGVDDYLELGVGGGVGNAFTVATWFKTNDSARYQWMFSYRPSSGDANEIRLRIYSSKLDVTLCDEHGSSVGGYKDYFGATTIQNNTWYYGALTWDGSALNLYVNGVADTPYAKSVDNSITMVDGIDRNRRIGLQTIGALDELRVWNRSLTAAEIQQQYYSNLQKYAPDKWLFQSSQSIASSGTNSFYAWASDSNSTAQSTETRIVEARMTSKIGFISQTPASGSTSFTSALAANISIVNLSGLSEFKFGFNGTNYTYYDDSLLLSLNFDNVASIGDNSTTATDSSKYGNNGTCYSSGAVSGCGWTNGKYGGAMAFNEPKGGVRISGPVVATPNSFTASAWIKPTNITSWNDRGSVIVGNYNGAYNGFMFYLQYGTGRLSMQAGNSSTSDLRDVGASSAVRLNEWSFVTLVVDTQSHRAMIYLNGVLDGNGTLGELRPETASLWVGRGQWGAPNNFGQFYGKIDEVRVWNRSLSSDEVSQQYYGNLAKYAPDKWLFQSVQAGFAEGSYSFDAYAKDLAGNTLPLEGRSVGANTIRLVSPSPANNAMQYENTITINATIADVSPRAIRFHWNGTPYTFYDDSLVLAYNFDNVASIGDSASKAVDVSKYQNNGTIYGASWNASGKYGGAMSFDGVDDYVSIPYLRFTGSNTLTFWANQNSKDYGGIVGIGGYYSYLRFGQISGSYLSLIFGETDTNDDFIQLYYSSPSTRGAWYQYALVNDGLNWSLYRNGVYQDSDDTSNPNLTFSAIGRGWSYATYNGSYDEIRFWNRALSADEIAQQYYGSLNKYAPNKWLFTSTQQGVPTGVSNYYLSAQDVDENASVGENRTAPFNQILFFAPSTANGTVVAGNNFPINATIQKMAALDAVKVTFGGTENTLYNDSLVLAYNFDDVAAIGDTAGTVKDISRYGNNGAIYGNTALLLHFDENSGSVAYDGGTYRNNGTISGAVWSAGKSGSGLQFDGVDDVVTIPNSASLNFTGPFSMEVWIKPSAVQSNLYPKVIAKQNHYVFHLTQTFPSSVVLNLFNASGLQQTGSNENAIASGVWNHVVLVYNGSYVSMYVNGTQLTTNNRLITSLAPTSEDSIGIGRYSSSTTPFNGSIDEVGLYNRTLSAAEVLAHYNAGKARQANWDPSGKWNSAMKFDGVDDYVDAGNSSVLNTVNAISIGAWVKPNSFSTYQKIANKWWDNTNRGYEFFADGSGVLYFNIATASENSDHFVNSPSNALVRDQWQYVAATYDGTKMRVYVNGVVVGEKSQTGSIRQNVASFGVGADLRIPRISFFNGSIDEVRVWNRSLSASEILQQYYSSLNKYAADKWVFSSYWNVSEVPNADYGFYLYSHDLSGSSSMTASRTVLLRKTMISFLPATPNDGAASPSSNVTINATIQNVSLANFVFNWNGTNTTIYDNSSLVLAMNFDDVAGIGDTAGKAVDASRYQNNGTIYGNTKLLWHMDEGSGATVFDESVNRNNGTVTGAAWVVGKSGSGLGFDGATSRVQHSDVVFGVNDSWSFSVWVRKPTGSGTYWQGMIGTSSTSGLGGYWLFHDSPGYLSWYQENANPSIFIYYSNLALGSQIPYDQWNLLTVVYRSAGPSTANITIFVNGGASSTSQLFARSPRINQFTFRNVGSDGAGNYFNGSMDELAIYNRTLTVADAQAIYNAGKAKHANWDPNGKWGSALKFDGVNDYVSNPEISFSNAQPWTYSIWLYKPTNSEIYWQGFIGDVPGLSESDRSRGYWSLHGGNLFLFKNYPTAYYNFGSILLGTTIPYDQWFNIAMNGVPYNATHVTLTAYLNGGTTIQSITIPSTGFRFSRVGMGDSSRCFNGSIDEVRIWNRSLTASEIRQQYYGSLNKYAPNKWLFTTVQQSQPTGTHNYTIFVDNGISVYNSTQARTVVVS